MAAIACAWLRKNVFQVCDGDPPRTMYFDTVDWATSKPSINSSPWIRDAPHLGFSLLIRRMRSRNSRSIFGRPGLSRLLRRFLGRGDGCAGQARSRVISDELQRRDQ